MDRLSNAARVSPRPASMSGVWRQVSYAAAAGAAVAIATLLLRAAGTTNPTTIALAYLLVVLFVGAVAELWTALLTSVAAMFCFNFFFLPPIGTLTLADPYNWIILFAFLVVSIVATQLSSSARAKARDAMDRRH